MTFSATQPELERRAKAAFDEIADLAIGERADALERLCRDDAALRRRVESLLAAHDTAEDFLDPPPPLFGFDIESTSRRKATTDSDDPLIGEHVARYRIIRRLGAGGMGVVYLAQQDEPARRVALKIMRAGLASRSMLRRFRHEAQVLGQLRHPGIAQIFEAGTFEFGFGTQPFFAMEYIDGRPLIQYAQQRELSMDERLELFARVCDVVHYAHQKGVIHRDLKPDNILVPEHDSGAQPLLPARSTMLASHIHEDRMLRCQPKILDFGVARLTNSDLAISTLKTDVGQIVGTLPYMSPEQVSGDPAHVDTRSDVYALGVIGFELLTGDLPIDFRHKSMVEAARLISTSDAPTLTSINRRFRGDVSTIIAKALERDRHRRYQSASELAEDVRRYLRHEPITARPATTLYQLGKFARRNKPLVAGALGVLLMLVLGIAGTSVGMVRAQQSARLAKQQQQAAEASEHLADQQRLAALEVSRFLQQMLASINPSFAQGRDTTLLRALLDEASLRVEHELSSQPDIAATLHGVIGRTYASISQYPQSISHLERSLEIRRSIFPSESQEVIQSLGDLGRALISSTAYERAQPLLLEARTKSLTAGATHPELTIRTAIDLGNLYWRLGDYRQAEPLLQEARRQAEAMLDETNPLRLAATHDLANVLMARRRLHEALPLFQHVAQIRERINGPESIELAIVEGNIARAQIELGDPEAIEHAQRAMDICAQVLPQGHDRLAAALTTLASAHYVAGEYEQAESLLQESIRTSRSAFGEAHPIIATALSNLATLAEVRNDKAEAYRLNLEALEMRRRTLPINHRDIALSLRQTASIVLERGDHDQALQMMHEALRIHQLHGEIDYDACETILNLGTYELRFGDMAQAEALYREASEMLERLLGPEHSRVSAAWSRVAVALEFQKKFAEALPIRQRILDQTLARGERDNEIAGEMWRVGENLCALDRHEEAIPLFEDALERTLAFFGQDHVGVARPMGSLGRCLVHVERYEQAEPLLLRSDRLWSKDYAGSPDTSKTRISLIHLYERTGRPEQAAQWKAILKSARPTPADDAAPASPSTAQDQP